MQMLINRFKALAMINKVSETTLSKFSRPLKCSERDPIGSFCHCPYAFRWSSLQNKINGNPRALGLPGEINTNTALSAKL